MGQQIHIPTTRTQCIGAYLAQPQGTPKGGIVVIQEIFGVNAHMRHVVDRFAEHGYTAIAPAVFDHLETGVELDYDEAGFAKGKQLVGELGLERALEDVTSAAQRSRRRAGSAPSATAGVAPWRCWRRCDWACRR